MRKKVIILFIIIFIIICFIKIIDMKTIIIKKSYPIKYNEIILKYAEEYNVDSYLILAIIKTESNFKSDSISSSNAKGLMQLLDSTAIELANNIEIEEEVDLFNEEINIRLGTYYISNLLNYYDNNLYLALAAYNAGIGNVNKWISDGIIKKDGSNIENIPYKETENYIRKVVRDYDIYKNIRKGI